MAPMVLSKYKLELKKDYLVRTYSNDIFRLRKEYWDEMSCEFCVLTEGLVVV